MKKRLIAAITLIAYYASLIKVMVFKDLPTIKIGHLMFNFGGADKGPANFIPFKTIVPYLFGNQGMVIAGVNLLLNVALLVPIGLLAPLVFRNFTWKKALVLSVVAGLSIEILQAALRLGIFDVDDIMLNALGVMVGFWTFVIFAKWVRAKKYKHIAITIAITILAMVAALYALYPKGPVVLKDSTASSSGNLCGNTPGTGQIISVGNNTLLLKRNDGSEQTIDLTRQTMIRTSAGTASISDLKAGDRVTVVVDGSETASTVLVCGIFK